MPYYKTAENILTFILYYFQTASSKTHPSLKLTIVKLFYECYWRLLFKHYPAIPRFFTVFQQEILLLISHQRDLKWPHELSIEQAKPLWGRDWNIVYLLGTLAEGFIR